MKHGKFGFDMKWISAAEIFWSIAAEANDFARFLMIIQRSGAIFNCYD